MALSEELYDAMLQYIRLRIQRKPYKKYTEPIFITSTGSKYVKLFEHSRKMLKETLGIEFPYSNHEVRNSAANTYAREFLDTKDLKLPEFPAQGVMNHSLKTHKKIYLTDTRQITHVGWRWLRKSATIPEILEENFNREQEQIIEIMRQNGASVSEEKPWNFEPTQWQKCEFSACFQNIICIF